jgi:hypothetical protein
VKPVILKELLHLGAGFFAPLALFLPAFSAFAAADPAMLCDRAAAQASAATGVPVDILLAISRVETGRRRDGALSPWPWTINADGKGAFYDSEAEAIAAAQTHETDGTGTYDIGCFQLNIRWHGEGFSTYQEMFDPGKNATYAARFLQSLYQEKGNWADAVAAYHSRTPDLAQTYLNQVKAVLQSPDTPDTAAAPQVPAARLNTFPLLQAGATGGMGSIVPVTGPRGPLIGGNS